MLLSMPAVERHYNVNQVADMWGFHPRTIHKMFEDEKGVLKIGHEATRFKRKRFKLSIPESVLMRVHSQRSN